MKAEEAYLEQKSKDCVKYHISALSKGIEMQFDYYKKKSCK